MHDFFQVVLTHLFYALMHFFLAFGAFGLNEIDRAILVNITGNVFIKKDMSFPAVNAKQRPFIAFFPNRNQILKGGGLLPFAA